MSIRKMTLTAIVLAIGGISSARAAELITNGDFETGNFSGWTQAGNLGFTGVGSGWGNLGTFGAYFGQIGSIGTISQVLNTVAGTFYTLSYDLVNYGGPANSFSVSVGSLTNAFADAPAFSYTHFVNSFFATSNSSTITFAFRQDPSYFALDNVSVQGLSSKAAPGPIAGAGLPVVLGLLGFAAWRRRQQAA